jgi:protein-tyrosine phosphatase
MFDVHCHILPNLDDGPKSWEIALEMCRMARQDGIEHIVATPHADDTYGYDRENALDRLNELRQRTEEKLEFSLGCDFHLSYDNLSDALAHPHRYTIAEKQYLLVELSNYSVPPETANCLFRLRAIGIQPILTHPERHPILQRHPQQVVEWVKEECIVQVTASALTGEWGEVARRSALWLLENHAVHVIATDAHDDRRRKPLLSQAREFVSKRFGAEVATALVKDNPKAMVKGEKLPFFPPPAKGRRKLLANLRRAVSGS